MDNIDHIILAEKNEADVKEVEEIAALANMLRFAKGSAEQVGSNFTVHCLDMAIVSLLEDAGLGHQLQYKH